MKNDRLLLSSRKSIQKSLEGIREKRAGLNNHRQAMLKKVPEIGDWAGFTWNKITTKDIAFLSAKTQHEFAILRGKKEDILFHGSHYHCEFEDVLIDMLMYGKVRLYAHSHVDGGMLVASKDDRNFLKMIGQEKSILVSAYDGQEREFFSGLFDV